MEPRLGRKAEDTAGDRDRLTQGGSGRATACRGRGDDYFQGPRLVGGGSLAEGVSTSRGQG